MPTSCGASDGSCASASPTCSGSWPKRPPSATETIHRRLLPVRQGFDVGRFLTYGSLDGLDAGVRSNAWLRPPLPPRVAAISPRLFVPGHPPIHSDVAG